MTSIDNVAQILNMCTYYYSGGILASAYVIQTDGDMYGIGENGAGQLGQGNTTDLTTWTQIGGRLTLLLFMLLVTHPHCLYVLW